MCWWCCCCVKRVGVVVGGGGGVGSLWELQQSRVVGGVGVVFLW